MWTKMSEYLEGDKYLPEKWKEKVRGNISDKVINLLNNFKPIDKYDAFNQEQFFYDKFKSFLTDFASLNNDGDKKSYLILLFSRLYKWKISIWEVNNISLLWLINNLEEKFNDLYIAQDYNEIFFNLTWYDWEVSDYDKIVLEENLLSFFFELKLSLHKS